jgi:hypothetical protein
MHEHKECEHELKYCSKCDKVYCELCKKEWQNYTITVSSPYSSTWHSIQPIGDEIINPINISPTLTCSHTN